MDLATHMFNQIDLSLLQDVPEAAENLADLLYEIGAAELKAKRPQSTIQWLERSHDIISDFESDRLSQNAPNLKMCTMQLLTKAYLALNTKQSREKAKDLLGLMDTEFGKDEVIVSLLQLDFIKSLPKLELQTEITAFHAILIRLFRMMQMTKDNFKILIHNVNKLRTLSPETACQALDDFHGLRLFDEQHAEYMEQIVVLRIWITLNTADKSTCIQDLNDFFDLLEKKSNRPFNEKVANGLQSLLWKAIEANVTQRTFDTAEALCQLALHPLLDNAGEGNKAKLFRKLMMCALETNNYSAARKAFFSMSEASQNHLQSRFLLYKAALRSNDDELGTFNNTSKAILILKRLLVLM
jgi:Meiosis protein SPO22/ZIP4 like